MIKTCICTGPNANGLAAKQQDEMYGHNRRVHNEVVTDKNQPQKYRCIVCGAVKT